VSPSLLQDIRKFIALCPSDFRINTEVTYLLVGWRPPAIAFYRLNDGIKIIKCDVSSVTLSSHSNAEITSRPLTIWVLH